MSTALAGGTAAAAPRQPAASTAQRGGELRFDIPAGPLDVALRAFEAATGLTLQVRLPADTQAMMQSPGVAEASPIAGTALRFNAMWTDTDVPNRVEEGLQQ